MRPLQYLPPGGHINGLFGAIVRHISAGFDIDPITFGMDSEFLKFPLKIYVASGSFCRAYVGFCK